MCHDDYDFECPGPGSPQVGVCNCCREQFVWIETESGPVPADDACRECRYTCTNNLPCRKGAISLAPQYT